MTAERKYRVYMYGFTLLELMIVIAIMSLLATIAIPNFISYRDKTYCNRAESTAVNVAAAISSYYGIAAHTGLPALSDLNIKTDAADPVSILGDPNTTITIVVVDKTGRCPADYMSAIPNWNAATRAFTKYIE